MDSYRNPSSKLGINKPPRQRRGRNEESCEHRRRVVSVEVVVKPVVVPVPSAIAEVKVEDVAVAVRVAEFCVKCHLCHRPLNTLGAESYSAYIMP